jgi:predicted transcriptional regulator
VSFGYAEVADRARHRCEYCHAPEAVVISFREGADPSSSLSPERKPAKKRVTISASIPEELSQQLSVLARALRRNRSGVIAEAIRAYVASEKQFVEAVEEGIRADDAGDVVPHEEVMRQIDALLDQYPSG